ncbi:MAG: anti-sigma factor antagonist [Deinococcota bacterium]
MSFQAELRTEPNAAVIVLSGELDANAAPEFRNKIETAASQDISKLVLDIKELSYMASAGLRTLVFARQKMGADVEIIVVGAQEAVRETIEMTGFHHSVDMVDDYQG